MGNTAMGGTTAILQELRRTNDRLDHMLEHMNGRLDQMDDRLDRMDAATRAERTNGISRHQNSTISSPYQELAVLQAYSDNTPIPDFPATPRDIARLTDANLCAILRSLELSVAGERLDKEGRLRLAIGLLEQPV
ncbi:MAG: hypothetical protein M1839_001330 [Geoglossum umbratile]|nr:MAG: hypothetical protein M1839_001330 [Geoglossum umbratile]